MARISEIVVAIEAEGTEKVLAALNQVEGAQVKSVKTTKQLGAQTKEATATAGKGWATLVTGVNQAIGVLQTVVQVGKAVYDFTKQGAQLEFMAGKFDRLSLAAGTTSDVLLNDLRKATQGTRSDMELMASAGDFMSLGLAKTSDEVIRLTTVAGALNMDMNQLVLTLANQTTMRFDQLGVSVDGFKEKVAGLEAAGMSANDAFKEAFLQQAEAQIQKVGNAADSSLGGLMQMESAFKNLSDVMKTDFADSMNEIAPLLTDVANGLTAAAQNGINYRDVMRQMKSALDAGVISTADYNRVMKEMGVNSAKGTVSAEKLQVATEFLSDAYAKTGATVDMTAESTIALAIAEAQAKNELEQIPGAAGAAGEAVLAFGLTSEKTAEMVDNFLEKAGIFKDDFAEIFSLSKNLGGMISFAKSYDDIMGEIAATEAELAKMPYWKQVGKAGDEAKEKIKGLKAELSDMANQVTLDMFQATIAIGGVTRTEMQAYFAMAEQMGIISHDAAQAAIAAYSEAVAAVSGASLDAKGNYTVDASQAYSALNQLVNDFEYINGMITFEVYYKNKTGEALLPPTTSAGDIFGIPKVVSSAIEATVTPTWAKTDFFTKSIEVPAAISTFDTSSYDDWQPADKPFISAATLDSSEVDTWSPPTKYGTVIYLPEDGSHPQAIGGPVYPDNTYLWQEPNREGELFVPEQYGRVMNNHQVAQAIREAMFASNAGGGRTGGAVTTDNSRHITYSINAQYKQEPVLTLSQHLKILSTLGGRA